MMQDDEKTVAERCSTGAKYTAVLVAVGIIVLVIGIFLQGSIPSAESNPGVKDYLNSLLNSENRTSQRSSERTWNERTSLLTTPSINPSIHPSLVHRRAS